MTRPPQSPTRGRPDGRGAPKGGDRRGGPQRPSEPLGTATRRAAIRLLDAVLRRGEPLEAALASATRALAGGPDRGLAHAIAAETLRRLPDLDALIDSATKQRLPDDAKARFALRIEPFCQPHMIPLFFPCRRGIERVGALHASFPPLEGEVARASASEGCYPLYSVTPFRQGFALPPPLAGEEDLWVA